MDTTLIEHGDTAGGQPSVTGRPSMGAGQPQETGGVGFRAGGESGTPVITLGTVTLGYEDVFLLLLALQTLSLLLETYREVSS